MSEDFFLSIIFMFSTSITLAANSSLLYRLFISPFELLIQTLFEKSNNFKFDGTFFVIYDIGTLIKRTSPSGTTTSFERSKL